MLRVTLPGMKNTGAKTPTRFSETASVLPRVEIFATGTHRGKTYTIRDLDDMVANFQRFSDPRTAPIRGKLSVPGVIGHDEADEQALLQNTGLEAAGWTERLWREGNILCARFSDVAPEVMRLIVGKRYRTVSSEVYDWIPDGLADAGKQTKMLRRVAFLGGEIPQVKSLADIPIPHSEQAGFGNRVPSTLRITRAMSRDKKTGIWTVFSEVVPMDREALIEKLKELGADTNRLQGSSDEALAEMVRFAADREDRVQSVTASVQDQIPKTPDQQQQPGQQHQQGVPPVPAPTDSTTPGDVTPVAETTPPAEGTNPDMPPPEGSPPEKMAAYHQKMYHKFAGMCKKMGDDVEDTGDDKVPEIDPDEDDKKGAEKMSEIERRLATADRMSRARLAAEKKATIKSRLDALVRAGKVLPAERNGDGKTPGLDVYAETLSANEQGAGVVKFGEKSMSQLDAFFASLEARPVLQKFGERVAAGQGQTTEDDEEAKVASHYEKFAETFHALHTTKDEMLSAFRIRKKQDPKLTAEEFLAVRRR